MDAEYPRVLCWNNFASKAVASCGMYLPKSCSRGVSGCAGEIFGTTALHLLVRGTSLRRTTASLCSLGSWLWTIFDALDQPVRLLSCWEELRYLARGITLLPSSPLWLSRRLHPSSRPGADITFQPSQGWDFEAEDLWMTQLSNHNYLWLPVLLIER